MFFYKVSTSKILFLWGGGEVAGEGGTSVILLTKNPHRK